MNGGHKVLLAGLPAGGVWGALGQKSAAPPSLTLSATRDEPKPLDSAGWRRPLFLGVCDFPKGLSSGKAWARVYSPAVWRCSGEFTSPVGGVKPPLH